MIFRTDRNDDESTASGVRVALAMAGLVILVAANTASGTTTQTLTMNAPGFGRAEVMHSPTTLSLADASPATAR